MAILFCLTPIPAWGDGIEIDLDPSNAGGNQPHYRVQYLEDGNPAPLAADDAVIRVAGDPEITAMIITIVNVRPFDWLEADVVDEAITMDYFNGVLTLVGRAQPEIYMEIMRSLHYENTSENPADEIREIRIEARNTASVSDPAYCRVQVMPINDPPVNSVPVDQLTPQDIPLLFSVENGNAISFFDVDLGENSLRVFLTTDRGTLNLTEGGCGDIQGNHTASVLLMGSLDCLNAAMEGMEYRPEDQYHGIARIVVESDDLGSTGVTGPLTDRDIIDVTVAVTISPEDPPSANAGEDQAVDEYTDVTLDGRQSQPMPPTGNLTYRWEQISGMAVLRKTQNEARLAFVAPDSPPEGATLLFRLEVTDGQGQKDTDEVAVTVRDTGAPHAAVTEGQSQILSVDPFAEEVEDPHWVQTLGPPAPLSDPQALRPTFVAPSVGSYGDLLIFQLYAGGESQGPPVFRSVITVADNGITGFPDGVLSFRPIENTRMGIRVAGGDLVWLEGVDPKAVSDMRDRPGALIYGLVKIQIRLPQPGGTCGVIIYFSSPAPDGFEWFKQDPSLGWRAFPNAVFSPARDYVSLSLTDGGEVDLDGAENGYITDPSGLGKTYPDEGDSASEDSGDSGCFLNAVFGDALVHRAPPRQMHFSGDYGQDS